MSKTGFAMFLAGATVGAAATGFVLDGITSRSRRKRLIL